MRVTNERHDSIRRSNSSMKLTQEETEKQKLTYSERPIRSVKTAPQIKRRPNGVTGQSRQALGEPRMAASSRHAPGERTAQ